MKREECIGGGVAEKEERKRKAEKGHVKIVSWKTEYMSKL